MKNNNIVFHNLVEQLPDDIVNNIYMMLPPHPVSAMFNKELENMGRHYGTDNLDDFFMVALREYKDKCRKKPKHGMLIEKYLLNLRYTKDELKTYEHTLRAFSIEHKRIMMSILNDDSDSDDSNEEQHIVFNHWNC